MILFAVRQAQTAFMVIAAMMYYLLRVMAKLTFMTQDQAAKLMAIRLTPYMLLVAVLMLI